MTIEAVLSGRIEALAADPNVTVQRSAPPMDHQQIFDEIDRTILPSELQVSSTYGKVLLRVSGRRLYSVATASKGEEVTPLRSPQDITIEDKTYAKDVATALRRVCDAQTDIRLDRHPLDVDCIDERSGLSVKSVREAFDDGDGALIDRFVETVVNDLTALMHLRNDTVVKTQGAAEHTGVLAEIFEVQVPDFVRAQRAAGISQNGPSVTAFADALEPGQGLLMARDASDVLLASCATDSLARLSKTFQRMV